MPPTKKKKIGFGWYIFFWLPGLASKRKKEKKEKAKKN